MGMNREELVQNSSWRPDGITDRLQFVTKDKGMPNRRPRVYFTCHPEDYEKYFASICEDIFKTQD